MMADPKTLPKPSNPKTLKPQSPEAPKPETPITLSLITGKPPKSSEGSGFKVQGLNPQNSVQDVGFGV